MEPHVQLLALPVGSLETTRSGADAAALARGVEILPELGAGIEQEDVEVTAASEVFQGVAVEVTHLVHQEERGRGAFGKAPAGLLAQPVEPRQAKPGPVGQGAVGGKDAPVQLPLPALRGRLGTPLAGEVGTFGPHPFQAIFEARVSPYRGAVVLVFQEQPCQFLT